MADSRLTTCPLCKTDLINAPGIGPYCPTLDCPVLDGSLCWNEDGTPISNAPGFKKLNQFPRFNELVREASTAQEAVDRWDGGCTWNSFGISAKRTCSLDEVVAEWDAANAALIKFVLDNKDVLDG